jgi:hypothetical protein
MTLTLLIGASCFAVWVLVDQLLWGLSACQSLFARRASFRTAGRKATEQPASKPGAAVVHPDPSATSVRLAVARDLQASSHLLHLPAVRRARRADRAPLALALPIGDISSSPDHQAFVSGVEVGVTIIALGIGAVVVFGLFRYGLSKVSNGE